MDLKDRTVLYVDDDSSNRIVMRHNLGEQYDLVTSASGEEALKVLEQRAFCVLLTDQRMPGMTGVELAARVRELYPDVVRVIITAHSDMQAMVDAINAANVSRFIKKPWTREELIAVLEESLGSWRNTRELKQMRDQLMKLDRMTSLAIMAGSIAHDLRQPLSYMEPSITLLQEDVDALLEQGLAEAAVERLNSMAESIGDLSNGMRRFQTIANTLLQSLRNHKVTREMLSLNKAVESALSLTKSTIAHSAQLEVVLPTETVWIMGSEGRTIQLLVNLLLNASQAVKGPPSESRITVRLSTQPVDALLEVEDNGCGIPEEQLQDIFQPFFTTKGAAGNGLGLAICKQIVDELDGTIHVHSTVTKGSRFIVAIPRMSRESLLRRDQSKPAALGPRA